MHNPGPTKEETMKPKTKKPKRQSGVNHIGFDCPADHVEAIKKKAEDEGRSLANYMQQLIKRDLAGA